MSGAIDLSLNPIGESQTTMTIVMRDSRLASMMRLFIAMHCNLLTYCTEALHLFHLRKKIFVDSLEKNKDGKRNRR